MMMCIYKYNKDVNSMKWDLSSDELFKWCNLLINPEHHDKINESCIINKYNHSYEGYGNILKTY
jgi:hypothetical protein